MSAEDDQTTQPGAWLDLGLEPSSDQVVALLDGIPGAWERIAAAQDDVRAGRVIPLDEI